jgi:hypothetical protein
MKMKMKRLLKYMGVLAVIVLLNTSCEDFLDVNVDPNNPTSVTPDLVLPTGMKYTAEYIQRDRGASHLGAMMMAMWSQSDGFSWYTDEFKYNVTSNFYDRMFADAYTAALKQYQILDNLTDEKDVNYRAIAKVMKAYHFQILVDFYGDVPYSEALLRKDLATPKYDDGATIYADLISQLDSAIMLIENADDLAEVPGDDDAIFGGDMGSWIQFANTVKLRILIRESDVMDVSAQIAAIEAQGSGYITDDVLINPGYEVNTGKQNRLWNDLGWDVGGSQTLSSQATCATPYALNLLASLFDDRDNAIYEEPATGHLGVPQGLLDYDTPVVDAYIPELVSNIGPGILKSGTMGANIFSLAEAHFLQAEAALKALSTGDAQTQYEAGVTASFDYLGVDIGGYLTNTTALADWSATAAGDQLEAIITQKWIAVNGITAEQAWFDYTRTGFPSGVPVTLQATTADRPVRLFYTADELSANGDNVPTQPDAFSGLVFWAE